MSRTLRRWLAQLLRRERHRTPHFHALRVDRPPKELDPNIVYVIGDDECAWAAILQCPCKCRAAIHLNLATDSRPRWTVETHKNDIVSLLPSVWRTIGCKSHFLIYRGHVFWCHNNSDDSVELCAPSG